VTVGALLMVVLLVWFLAEGGGTLKTKETKGNTTTEYSDNLVIAGLALGALLVLCGAFFGRIREITLPGGAGLKLAELTESKKETLQEKVTEKASAAVSVERTPEVAVAAYGRALEKLRAQFPGAVLAEPPDGLLDSLAAEAVDEVKPPPAA
jgi:hypothetical protein